MRLIDADELYEVLDCGFDVDMDELPETKAALLEMIKNQPTIEPQHWIPVTERLPEKYIGKWICCMDDGAIDILAYDTPGDGSKECVFYYWQDDYTVVVPNVTAWMPLPAPWKGGESDGS